MYCASYIFSLLLFLYAAINVLYLLVVAVAGRWVRPAQYAAAAEKKRIAVLITSFMEDAVILDTVRAATQHNYPAERFDVFLAADRLQPETLAKLRQLPVILHEVHFETGSKAKSLNHLLNVIDENSYEIALILDGDNIMEEGFLDKVNAAFDAGFGAVQGHRTAKNRNTPIALLDALSEETNNHLFRKGQRALGFSSATIGSGMAFRFSKLKEVYNKPGILDNPACDREVDFEMMKAGIVVEYLDGAHVLDEKVAGRHVYRRQRRRWLESQLVHLRLFFSRRERVVHKTKDYWNKLFINLIPPRLLFTALLGAVLLIYLLQYLFHFHLLSFPLLPWLILCGLYFIALLLSIPGAFYTFTTLAALAHLPVLLFAMLKAATGLKPSRKEFVHTPKTFTKENESPK